MWSDGCHYFSQMGDIVWLLYHGDVLETIEFDVDIRRRLRRRQPRRDRQI